MEPSIDLEGKSQGGAVPRRANFIFCAFRRLRTCCQCCYCIVGEDYSYVLRNSLILLVAVSPETFVTTIVQAIAQVADISEDNAREFVQPPSSGKKSKSTAADYHFAVPRLNKIKKVQGSPVALAAKWVWWWGGCVVTLWLCCFADTLCVPIALCTQVRRIEGNPTIRVDL